MVGGAAKSLILVDEKNYSLEIEAISRERRIAVFGGAAAADAEKAQMALNNEKIENRTIRPIFHPKSLILRNRGFSFFSKINDIKWKGGNADGMGTKRRPVDRRAGRRDRPPRGAHRAR